MNEIELKKLWDKISLIINFGTFELFKSKMDTVDKRKRFYEKYYNILKEKNVYLGVYDKYELRLSDNSTQAPQPSPGQTLPPSVSPETNIFSCLLKDETLRYNKLNNTVYYYEKGYYYIFYSNYRCYFSQDQDKGTWSCDGTDGYNIKLDDGSYIYRWKLNGTDNGWHSLNKTNNATNTGTTIVDTNLTGDDLTAGKLVKYGMKGDIVGTIQNLLIQNGFTNISKSGKPDNIFGSKTFKSVKDFQRDNGLNPDGVVGPKTWLELNKVTNKRPSYEVGSDDSPEYLQSKYTPEINEETIIKKIVNKNLKSYLK
jgi:hypothetical protein